MKTASQILEAKGYDSAQANDIVCANNDSLDLKVREEFGINEPIHLYECYNLGEADEELLNGIAIEKGYEDCKELLTAMDRTLIKLAEEYPAIGVQCLIIDDLDEFCDEYCRLKNEMTCDLFDDNGDEADGNCYMIPLSELPQNMDFEEFGEIVWAKKIEYDNETQPTGRWIGWSSTNVGYIAL